MKTIGKGFLFGLGMYFARDFYKGLNKGLDKSLRKNCDWYNKILDEYYGKNDESKPVMGFKVE